MEEFNDFLKGRTPHDYVEDRLRAYFQNKSQWQGQISLFVDPLDNLGWMQDGYTQIAAKALHADGPSKRQIKLAEAGQPIKCLVGWLEDIWHSAIDGPQELRLAYGKQRLRWQRDSIW